MAKVMLVEDDNNLREIYGARLLAEGYEIVSAKDGEEALALAVKEKPDLIITDVMMPKISGFDMLDILRSTPETKNTKIVMMTALSQAEDKTRADKLGADRYLVKSQVTLEDVAKTARELLGDEAPAPAAEASPAPAPAPAPAQTASDGGPSATPTPTPIPVAAAPAAVPEPAPTPTPAPAAEASPAPAPAPAAVAPAPATTNDDVLAQAVANLNPASAATESEKPSQEQHVMPTSNEGPKTSVHTKVISPINDITKPNEELQKLLAAEEAQGTAPAAAAAPSVPQAIVQDVTPPPAQPTPSDSAEDVRAPETTITPAA